MKNAALSLVALFCTVSVAFSQTATLSASGTTLAATGGTVAFTASVNYEGQPSALGWSIALPADWTLESVVGPNLPAIGPEVGAGGTLEFAYTEVPASRAEFTIFVRYPAGSTTATATPTVLMRSGGKLTTLKPASVELRIPGGTTGSKRTRN